VANGAGARKDFALLAYMAIIMTSETSRPVAVTDIVGVGRPVHFHGREDVPIVNCRNRIDRLVNLGFLIFEDVREVFGVIPFNKLTDSLFRAVLILVIFHQGIQGQLLDPRQFWGNISACHGLIHSRFRRIKDMGRPVVTIHTIHEVNGQLLQLLFRNLSFFIFVNDGGAII
jgi:hypothetical protein